MLHALYDVNGTALALVDAAFAVGDELVQRKRLPSLGGVREQGSKLLSQILTLSGAWSPEAPALVSAVLEQEVLAPLNSTGAEAMRSLRLLTGEDVGAAMATLLENAPGNKVDALQVAGSTTAATTADSPHSTTTILPPSLPLQTMLRAIVRLYRNAFVELIGDARAATAPWKHNLTLAATEIVDAIHDAPPKLWKKLQAEVRDASRTGAPHTRSLTCAAPHAQPHARRPTAHPAPPPSPGRRRLRGPNAHRREHGREHEPRPPRRRPPRRRAAPEGLRRVRRPAALRPRRGDRRLAAGVWPPSLCLPPALPYLNPYLSHASPPSPRRTSSPSSTAPSPPPAVSA